MGRPIKCLGKWFDEGLHDQEARAQVEDGIKKTPFGKELLTRLTIMFS